MTVKLYIVCHRLSHPENADQADERLWWYAVNESIPKKILAPPEKLIKEWELPVHDPTLQRSRYDENSAILHVYANTELRDCAYVGFAQYDMKIPSASLDAFQAEPGDRKVGYGFASPFVHLLYTPLPLTWWESYFRSAYPDLSLADIADTPLPLCNTYILPTSAFLEMVSFVQSQLFNIRAALCFDDRHLGGTLERAFALWVSGAVRSGLLGPVVHLGFEHLREQTLLRDRMED